MKSRILTALLVLAYFPTFADDAKKTEETLGQLPVMELQGMKLVSSFQSVSHALRTLERGFPQMGLAEAAKPTPETPAADFSAMIQQLDAQIRANQDASETSLAKVLAEEARVADFRNNFTNGREPSRSPSPAAPARAKASAKAAAMGTSVQAFDLPKFKACAVTALPILHARLRYLTVGDSYGAMRSDAILDPERGDGQSISPQGMACGKFLGTRGMKMDSTIQDIKALSALQSTTAGDDLLWKLFAIHSATSKTLRLPDSLFWAFAWKEASFNAVFRPSEKMDLSQLLKRYLEYAREMPQILVGDLTGIESRVTEIVKVTP